ncbi:hypothetical protein GDO81_028558 [Engystomops pustulosus]|uniref:Taste receptor type 2 n=1 Tax=Engystomops pustulosus TaxID=76066 RepID=A0AAV6ZGB0_ENGPU|nr:hypothetical protein GDO81_028558 [Engystomops pustulosus]
MLVDCMSLLMTFPGYIFIIVVNILDWRRNKRLNISDQLISGLGLLTLLHKIAQVTFRYDVLLGGLHVHTSFTWFCIRLTFNSLNFCILLLSTLLAIHFCLKIVNINQNFYIYIQRMFPKMFPWILLPSVLVSLLISVPAAQSTSQLNSISFGLFNTSSFSMDIFISVPLYYTFYAFRFAIFFILLLTTILSLSRHIHWLRNNSGNLGSETVQAHVGAVKTLSCLFFLNLLQFCLPIFIIFEKTEHLIIYVYILLLIIWHILDLPILF